MLRSLLFVLSCYSLVFAAEISNREHQEEINEGRKLMMQAWEQDFYQEIKELDKLNVNEFLREFYKYLRSKSQFENPNTSAQYAKDSMNRSYDNLKKIIVSKRIDFKRPIKYNFNTKEELRPESPNAVIVTYIYLMMYYRETELLKLILENGAKIFERDGQASDLHESIGFETPIFISLLLKHKANPNVLDYQGNTPLHLIVKTARPHYWDYNKHYVSKCDNCKKIVEDLIKFTDFTIIDKDGFRAYEYCKTDVIINMFKSEIDRRTNFLQEKLGSIFTISVPLINIIAQYCFGDKESLKSD